jgi:MEMO1 family protein
MSVRKPAVAGTFYAATRDGVEGQLEWCYQHRLGPGVVPEVDPAGPREIVALVAPHAGYMASGPVAAHVYHALARDGLVDTAVIVGPNHTGYGTAVSVWVSGAWTTPLGDARVDEDGARQLVGGVVRADESAHIYEHSVEVQVPWLQHLYGPAVRIVPVAMLAQDHATATELGAAMAKLKGNVVIIASTDFTHYEPQESAARKDTSVIEAIESLDSAEMYHRLGEQACSMCGYGPVAAVIHAAKLRGATRTQLLKYATSCDVVGDYSRVVGYAAVALMK